MDSFLRQKGDFNPSQLEELQNMTKEEIIEFTRHMSMSWYSLFVSLEHAHQNDLRKLTKNLEDSLAALQKKWNHSSSELNRAFSRELSEQFGNYTARLLKLESDQESFIKTLSDRLKKEKR